MMLIQTTRLGVARQQSVDKEEGAEGGLVALVLKRPSRERTRQPLQPPPFVSQQRPAGHATTC